MAFGSNEIEINFSKSKYMCRENKLIVHRIPVNGTFSN